MACKQKIYSKSDMITIATNFYIKTGQHTGVYKNGNSYAFGTLDSLPEEIKTVWTSITAQ